MEKWKQYRSILLALWKLLVTMAQVLCRTDLLDCSGSVMATHTGRFEATKKKESHNAMWQNTRLARDLAKNDQYRKIPKISSEAYIFQRPFLKGLFLEVLIFGGAYLRREICVSKSIGPALYLEVNFPCLLCFTLYLRAIFQVQAPGKLMFGGAI